MQRVQSMDLFVHTDKSHCNFTDKWLYRSFDCIFSKKCGKPLTNNCFLSPLVRACEEEPNGSVNRTLFVNDYSMSNEIWKIKTSTSCERI